MELFKTIDYLEGLLKKMHKENVQEMEIHMLHAS